MNKEKKYIIFGMVMVIVLLIGFTYAFYQSEFTSKDSKVTIDTDDMRIIFTNGENIEASDVYAEDNLDIVKTFIVENKTSKDYKYNIVLEDLINTFKTEGYLVYKITSTDGGYSMSDFEDIPKSGTANDTVLAYSVNIPGKAIHNYSIEIKYINSTTANQDDDQGAKLSGKLYITEGTVIPTLLNMMLRDNPTISERTDFSVINISDTTGTLYKTNKTENGSDVYYYSGNTTNNWVFFAGFYWKIIRTNEDGSVRLLYSGTSKDTTEGYIGINSFNSVYSNPMYVGYMYGSSGSLDNNRLNTSDSNIKSVVDTWYKNNLLNNYDKYISKSAIYCNDRSVGNGTYSTTTDFYYGAYTRLDTNTPSYKCGANAGDGLFESTQAVQDKFSASTDGGGNGQLKYPIALMTADEIVFAGGIIEGYHSSLSAWYYMNSEGSSITGTNYWWTMTPSRRYGSGVSAWYVGGLGVPGSLNTYYFVDHQYAVRPVISLSSCVKVNGNGTVDNPYVIDGVCK